MITLSRDNMRISPEFEVMDGGIFNAYIETWFDVDEKFGVNTKDRDDVWLNLYEIQIEMSTSREFMFIIRFRNESSEQSLASLNKIEKMINEQGFECSRVGNT